MGKFLLKCCFILPVLFVLIGVNYFVDPGNVFHAGKAEKEIAAYMAKGKNVTNAYNFDDRLMRRNLLHNLTAEPDITVIGSSRGGFISTNVFPGKKINNNFLTGAVLEDYLTIFDIIESKKWRPKKVILTLDPWLLNDGHTDPRWMILEKNYDSMVKKLGITADKPMPDEGELEKLKAEKWEQIISFTYFQSAIMRLRKKDLMYYPTDKRLNYGVTYVADGSMSYHEPRRNATVSDVAIDAQEFIDIKPVYCLGGYKMLSRKKINMLEKFIDHVKASGTELEVYLPPYHPLVYKYLAKSPDYKIITSAEKYFLDLANRKHITCRGSYNPAVCNITDTLLYDGLHAKEAAVEKIFKAPPRNVVVLKSN